MKDYKVKFSLKERTIIKLISEGKSSSEIAKELKISENTVKTHRKKILNKSSAKNFFQLIADCIRDGLIE